MDRLQLHIEGVAHLAVRVGRVADTVELEVGIAEPGLRGSLRELHGLGELNAIRRGLHGVVPDLARVSDGIQEVGA